VYNWTLDIVIFRYPPPISRPLSIGYTTRSQLRLAKKYFLLNIFFFNKMFITFAALFKPIVYFNIRNKINVHSRLVLFPLHFTKFSLETVSIRVKFGSSKKK